MMDLGLGTTRLEHGAGGISTVFLDRDGTVNVKAPEGQYVTSPEQLALLPGAAVAISRLNVASVQVILVTNQRWLSAQPNVTAYERVHTRLVQLLAEHGAHLDAAYYCPHASSSCGCRKPAPGMLERAAQERALNLANSVMIGDYESDIAAGRAVGTATILLSRERKMSTRADFVAPDLAGAVRLVLESRRVML